MRLIKSLILLIVLVVIAIGIWIWSGTYNFGADSPHWTVTKKLIGTARERSIDTRAREIDVPNLDDPALVELGAQHYKEMCTGCHLAPGMGDSELRDGLYPEPPNLTHFAPNPAEAFWIIKHGIKMTAMPAWGKTHDDHKIWAMVAYLQKQPSMSVEQYRQLTANAVGDEAGDASQPTMPASEPGTMPGMTTSTLPLPAASLPAPASSTH